MQNESNRCQSGTSGDYASKLARRFGVSRRTVFRAADYADAIDSIEANVGSEAIQKLTQGSPRIGQKETKKIARELTPDGQRALFRYDKQTMKEIIKMV